MYKIVRDTSKQAARLLTILVALLGLVLSPMTALAMNNVDTINVPTTSAAITDITAGPNINDPNEYEDDDFWFTERDANKIGRVTTDSLTVQEYALPTPNAGPTTIITASDNAVWFVESNVHKIGRSDANGTITEYPISATAVIVDMTAGPDGNIWFTDAVNNQVSRMTTAGVITDYAIPTANAGPNSITADLKYTYEATEVWFTETNASKIAKISTETGEITEYETPVENAAPTNIAVSYGGGSLYFTEPSLASIGVISMYDGFISGFTLPDPLSVPDKIITGNDQAIWFTDLKPGQYRLGRVDNPSGDRIWEYDMPTTSTMPLEIAVGIANANVWFVQPGVNTIGRMNITSCSINSETELTVHVNQPFEFTVYSDGTFIYDLSLFFSPNSEISELPEGITYTYSGGGSGIISGTPTEDSIGEYQFYFHVQSPSDQNDQLFVLTIAE